MKAFILAGGFATRLWPLTEKRAKPLLPLAGKALITHLVEKVPEGIPITLSTNQVFAKDFEMWRSAISGPRPAKPFGRERSAVNILIEDGGKEEEKLGAVGALAAWISQEKIDDDVLLLAGDNYVGFSLRAFLERFSGEPLIALHDIRSKEKAKSFGVVTVVGETVKSFEEKPQNPASTLVSTGVAVIPKALLTDVVEFSKRKPDNIGGIFEHFLSKGISVRRVSYLEPWFDIGSFESYLEATKALVGSKVLLGELATCNETTCNGSVTLGKRSHVTRCLLEDVVIFDDCAIEDCHLERCIIDNGCCLSGVDLTGKMLRARTVLKR